MEKISEEELHKLLKTGVRIREKEINLSNIDLENINLARFENCNFTSPRTHFTKNPTYENETITQKINISFKSCSFNDLLILKINNFENVSFSHIKIAKSILIHHSNCNSFNFEDNDNINYHIEILGCDFQKHFTFTTNTFEKKGKFQLYENTFREKTFITKNTFNDLNIERQYFKEFLGFKNNFIKDSTSLILNSEFEEVTFNKSNFSNLTFNKCDFLNTTWFEECEHLDNSKLRFVACKFEKYSLFDNSKFNKIEILHSKFQEKVSFENLETNSFKIHQVTFAEAAYFDDLNKNNNKAIENWDRKTLRAIKRELINTHNQIDYLRFKAYELNAYDKEKGKNCKDQIVLFFNRHSNYFGLDWTRGVCFIFITSFSFYLLYLITFIIAIENTLFLPKTFEDFSVIYIKFLNPFSFLKTPIPEADEYFFPLLLLNLSKIFVSYGIYQTIQAFRKFGVNGG
ncbi:MAG: hypothetical protein PHC28_04295 [Flavobacterium sp.]|uniref:hypothetical protein n=1 Tax=Flavobacterium sp. TaxID=239 RepID=UPI00262BE062|nr:hypothetical protein [Flavobacterium sp.]MDD5149684.1 hypothetical protein [Flavobacterium sp.]